MVDEKNLPPGPTQYSHRSLFDYNKVGNQGKTMSKKFEGAFNTNSETVDSFNNYFREGKPIYRNQQTYSIGKEKREIFKGEDKPGPTDVPFV